MSAAQDVGNAETVRIVVQMSADEMAHRCGLSPQQKRILDLYLDGIAVKDCLQILGVSAGTMKSHVQGMFRRCKVRGRDELVAKVLGRR